MTDDAPGVRANALRAEVFVPLRDVDSRVVEPLLDSLEDAGVAAYAERQAAEASDERLYVDGHRRDVAEAVVTAELPGLLAELDRSDPDAEFAAIVANWDADVDDAARPWPVDEDIDAPTRPQHEIHRVEPADEPVVWRASESELIPALEAEYEPDDEEHYVPPPPPPLPPAQMATKFAVAAIVLGVMCLVGLQGLLGFPTGGAAYGFGAICVLGGIATLVYRMRDTPPVDDGPDDGAVV